MLRGLFDLDNPPMRFLSKVADLLILNLLFLVCSLPVITIGASTTAVYYCFFKMKDQEDGYLFRKFFKSFKENFRQATLMWLPMLLLLAILLLEFFMYRDVQGRGASIVRAVILVGLIFWFLITQYSFALLSRFYNTIRGTVSNAAILIFGNGPRSIVIVAAAAALLWITLFQTSAVIFWNLILYWTLLGFAVDIMINAEMIYPVIRKLMPEEASETAAPDSQFVVDEEADLSSIGYAPAPSKAEEDAEAEAETEESSLAEELLPVEEPSFAKEPSPTEDTPEDGMQA